MPENIDEISEIPLDSTFKERVSAGIAYLNKNKPDWLDSINLDLLNITDCSHCILGQVFGTYFVPSEVLTYKKKFELGFALPSNEGGTPWSELEQEWIKQIKALKS